ncbi:MAG: lipocalin family protein, partial [Gammaproteobacteria bacterium]
MTRQISLLLVALLQFGCTSLPENVTPVKDFDLNQYLGPWYEIARMDHSFERNLIKVTANYSRRDDGGVDVINRGYNVKTKEWEQADGKAYFVSSPDVGHL